MPSIDIAKGIAKLFEGFRSKPYRCPAGVATIGYGTTMYPNGQKVTMDDKPATVEDAEVYLEHEMLNCQSKALKYCPGLSCDENRLAAVTDFIYNLGPGQFQNSTLRRRINQQDWPEVKKELMRWVRGGGKILPGLVKRRVVEAKLI